MKNVGFIGYGSMGSMLVNGFLTANVIKQSDIFISTKTKTKLEELKILYPEVNICDKNEELASRCNYLFICVKPLEVKNVLSELSHSILDNTHIISIAGCVTLNNIASIFPGKVTKVIPSLTSEVKEGISLVCHNEKVTQYDKKFIERLLNSISRVKIISEEDFELGGDLTSCAPGLIACIFSEFVKTSNKHSSNISLEDAEDMVISTLYGTAKLLYKKKIGFDDMISRVATKGGITQEGVSVLEKRLPDVFDELFQVTLEKHEKVKNIVANLE